MVVRSEDSCAERVADAFLLDVGAGSSPDAIELAQLAGLRPIASDVHRATLAADGTLDYPAGARHVDQQRSVAQHLAGWLLQRDEVPRSRELIAHTAAALLLPRAAFLRDSILTDWNLRLLQVIYPNATLTTLALRIGMLHESVVTCFDRGGLRCRSVTCSELESPTRFEQHLAEIARETETVLHPEPRVWAFPLKRSPGAVLVCGTQALLDRRD